MDKEQEYAIAYTHVWTAGMSYVHQEDVAGIHATGRRMECERCEDFYPSQRPCPYAHDVTLELAGFVKSADGAWTW